MVRDIVKQVGGAVTAVGTGVAVSTLLSVATPCWPITACVWVGKLVVADMVTEKAVEHFERRVDETADYIKDLEEKPGK